MNRIRLAFLIALCQLSTACGAGDSAQPIQALVQQPAQQTTSSVAASTLLGDGLKEGMTYADFHNALLAQGWVPVVDKQCKANVVGGDYKTSCATHPDSTCNACDVIPELSSCGADGVCLTRFHNANNNKNLEVGTYGDTDDWNVHGGESRILVTGWSITPAASR